MPYEQEQKNSSTQSTFKELESEWEKEGSRPKKDPENILPYITVKSVLGCSVVHSEVHQAIA